MGQHRQGGRRRNELVNKKRQVAGGLLGMVIAGFLLLTVLVVASAAFADAGESEKAAQSLTPQLIKEASESPTVDMGSPSTDPNAAQQLPHDELGRSEASELLNSVFGSQIESPGGPLEDIQVEKFLSDNAAVVSSDELLNLGSAAAGEGSPEGASAESVLIESSLPLRTEDSEGHDAPVDLSLHEIEGELQPVNPLVDSGIPLELGDGISLLNDSVSLDFPDATQVRSPSLVEGNTAFYPNVQTDTDLAVTPTPEGIETFTQLRTPEAPLAQTIQVGLPAGAILEEVKGGGARAELNGRTLLTVPTPVAVDAQGNNVPLSLTVSGSNLELSVSPPESASYPILVDPDYQMEAWNWTWENSSLGNWEPVSSTASYASLPYTYWDPNHFKGLDMTSGFPGSAKPSDAANWFFHVPRFWADKAQYQDVPQSYIEMAQLGGVNFLLHGNNAAYPLMVAGIIDETAGWVSMGTHSGYDGEITGWAGNYYYPNYGDTNAKYFVVALQTGENEAQAKWRDAFVATATIAFGDHNTPQLTKATGPSGWMDKTETGAIGYTATDPGLGVYEVRITKSETWGEGTKEFTSAYKLGCTGVPANPCMRTIASSESGRPVLPIEPQYLPQGINKVKVSAADPLGAGATLIPNHLGEAGPEPYSHKGEAEVAVKVDHAAPTLTLSGTLTQQASLGTAKPQYALKYNTADGTREPATMQTTFGAEGSASGQFKHPADVALDSSENIWVADQANNRIEKLNVKGEFLAAYGTLGSGNGQLSVPSGIEVDEKSNIWVADTGNNRIEKFGAKGEYLTKFGTVGTGNGQLSAPKGVAIAANGNIWVADTGDNRIEEFSSTGTFIGAFGAKGSGNLQFSEPTALDIGPGGKVWVADAGNNRIEVLNEKGEFLAVYGTLGSGSGQFNHPTGIDVDAKGNVYVLDQNNGRVEQLSERGEYRSQFGAKGTGSGQFTFSGAAGLTTNIVGEIWVTDSADNRVEEWNPPKGTRSGVRKVVVKMDGKVVQESTVTCPQGGCPLSGEWLLHSGEYTAGAHTVEVVATDGVELSKTEKLNITLNPPAPSVTLSGTMTEQATLGTTRPRYVLRMNASAEEGTGTVAGPPTYSSSFGSAGTGNGQFSHPAGIAVDAAGNLWVADSSNNRIEEFSEKGEFLKTVGSTGTGNGQFTRPKSIAIDPKGNFWVADAGNSRLEEFNSKWEFLKVVGSAGSGNGQFNGPEGISIDVKGNIWVADTYNYRVQELNEAGGFVKVIAGLGAIEPTGLAVGPGGNVWIADWAHNRVAEVNEAGTLLRSFGSQGTGNGQFNQPDVVAVDASGNVWVGDQNNSRVQEFNQSGEYLAQFGAAGSGAGQFSFSYPMGIAADAKGNLWISDTNNNRVQRWRQGSRSRVTTEVTLDGKQVDSGEASCATETCPITREWVLGASSQLVGKHTIVAKATDGYGQWTSKSRTIEIQPDAAKPTVNLGGELANAPEGWVQQESYGFNATATDGAGYGVTSLVFRIDGTAVASSTQPCQEGACQGSISKGINMGPYSGGAHEAQVIATDGAGNSTTKSWTINVDPDGQISTSEATATMEAVEETSESNLVGDSKEEDLSGTMAGLGLESTETGFVATGTAAPMTVAVDPSKPIVVEVPEAAELFGCHKEISSGEAPKEPAGKAEPAEEGPGKPIKEECDPQLKEGTGELQPIEITPQGVGKGSTSSHLVGEDATVSANTGSATDTVVRPLNDGGMVFQAIRDSSAPEDYSYKVELGEEQVLRSVDETHAEVYYSGHIPAFSIAAEPAHDAVGTAVPTTLTVEGRDTVTLHIHYKAGQGGQPFVYPVMGGTGWEGGFRTIIVDMDNLPPEEKEEDESEWFWSHQVSDGSWAVAEGGRAVAGPPEFEPQASASGVVVGPSRASRSFSAAACWHFPFGGPSPPPHPNPNAKGCQITSNLAARGWVHGHFHWETAPNQHVWWNGGREGEIGCTPDFLHNAEWRMWQKECHFAGPNQQPGHIVARNFWRVETYNGIQNGFGYQVICIPMYLDLFSNGNVGENKFYEHGNAIRFVSHGESCPWPQ